MKEKYRQLLGAFFMGVLLPQLLLSLPLHSRLPTQKPNTPTGRPSLEVSAPENLPWQIPVLQPDGTVTQMVLEEYLVGVVLGEMPAEFETEALKAQAVVARTYALKRQEEGTRHPEGAVCVDPGCCQAYTSEQTYLLRGGSAASVEKIRAAVGQTAGQVLTYEGMLIEATYFSCSGGRTEDAAAVWGTDVPYLQAVDSPGEEHAGRYQGQLHFSGEEFARRLDLQLQGAPESWLGMVTYTEGSGVATMTIGGMAFSGVRLRKLLGLNSTMFYMEPGADGITVYMQGYGHRVGMSQYGADAMAVTGSDYTQILAYYYRGTELTNWCG